MSVLNQMLRDLEARGEPLLTPAAPSAPLHAGTGVVGSAVDARNTPALGTPRVGMAGAAAAPGRALLWGATLAAVAAIGAGLHWRGEKLRAASTVRAPLGQNTYQGALAAVPSSAAAAPTLAPASEATAAPVAAVTMTRPELAAPPATKPAAVAPERPASAINPRPMAPPARPAAPTPVTPAAAIDTANLVRRSTPAAGDIDARLARAADLIARGRAFDAMTVLRDVLAAEPSHEPARRALAALYAEAGQRDAALRTLLDGVNVDPARFAASAAALQAELGDGAGALATLARVPAAAQTGAQRALAGGLAHRIGRHDVAIDHYRAALSSANAEPAWWIGLAVALESHGARDDARAAYDQALAAPLLRAELRQFASQKRAQLVSANPTTTPAVTVADRTDR